MIRPDDFLLFIGADPALQGDYFGIAVHALPKKKPVDSPWLPLLVDLFKMQASNYKAMWDNLNDGVLTPYRNFYRLNIDYTNEKTIADFLEDRYGSRRIVKTPFTKGESGSKMQMAQNSLQILESGYAFPDHNKIVNPVDRENIRKLKQQILNEEVVLNADGSVKFKHKGAHNDLLHAWMLSLDEVMRYILKKQGSTGRIIGASKSIPKFHGKSNIRDELGSGLSGSYMPTGKSQISWAGSTDARYRIR